MSDGPQHRSDILFIYIKYTVVAREYIIPSSLLSYLNPRYFLITRRYHDSIKVLLNFPSPYQYIHLNPHLTQGGEQRISFWVRACDT